MVHLPVFISLPPATLDVAGFQGPLELLLHHLDDGSVIITTLSLAQVADQYLAAVRLLPDDSARFDVLADFLVVAAQLLVLKSRALLPREANRVEPPDELDAAALAARLEEYRQFREAAAHLHERHERGERAFVRPVPPPLPETLSPPPLEPAEPEQLARALQRLLATRLPKQEPEPLPRLSIKDRMALVRDNLRANQRVSFLWLANWCESRADLIVTFLAVLELYRAHEIELEQDTLFGEIWLSGRGASRYTAPASPALSSELGDE